MKTLILSVACLILAIPCQAVERQLQPDNQIEQTSASSSAVSSLPKGSVEARLKIQQQRLKDIEQLAVSERQAIEQWYARHLTELRQLAQRQAKQLILSQRMLWTEFIKMNNQIPHADTYFKMNDQIPFAHGYFKDTAPIFIRDVKAFELREAMIDSYFLSTAANLLLDHEFCKLLTDLSNGSAYNPQNLLIRSEARKLLRLAKEFESDLMRLENRRNDRLAGLERWEKGLREHVYKVMREIQALPETVELGVVSAISYDEKGSLCMIDGVDKVLQPGDTIQNVTVVRIHQDRVEFAKDGQRWVQVAGQPANPAWK